MSSINESTFKNAQTALNISGVDQVNVRIVNNLYQNCRIGIYANGSNFYDGISGNTFNMDRNAINYEVDCRFLDYEAANNLNNYEDDHWGILALRSTFLGNISQNDFINAQEIRSEDISKIFYGI